MAVSKAVDLDYGTAVTKDTWKVEGMDFEKVATMAGSTAWSMVVWMAATMAVDSAAMMVVVTEEMTADLMDTMVILMVVWMEGLKVFVTAILLGDETVEQSARVLAVEMVVR
jgi:hypothetical protein